MNYYSGNSTEKLNIAATISLSDTTKQSVLQKTSHLAITKLFSHSLGRKATVASR